MEIESINKRPKRNRKAPELYTFDGQHGYKTIKHYCKKIYSRMMNRKGQEKDMQYVIALLLDPSYGIFDNLPINMFVENPHFMKAAATKDPDTPNLKDALMNPEHRDHFLKAMEVEITELEAHNTGTVMNEADMPEGANLLPSWSISCVSMSCLDAACCRLYH